MSKLIDLKSIYILEFQIPVFCSANKKTEASLNIDLAGFLIFKINVVQPNKESTGFEPARRY